MSDRLTRIYYKRRGAYHATFQESGRGAEVLDDLADFCGLGRDSFDTDALVTAYNLGRKSVMLHIAAVLRMSNEEIEALGQESVGFQGGA